MTGLTNAAAVPAQNPARRVFAVVSTWPETKNAEYEVIERILTAARNIDCDVLTIDNDGYIIASTRDGDGLIGARITREHCEFVISLHFQSPRLYDIDTYITLWNPPEFYHVFGYQPSIAALASHSDVLSCHSDMADRHALNVFGGFGRHLDTPLPTLFHSLPKPYLDPVIGPDSRLFYIGINWERISGTRGRHHDLLERLDAEDLINIHGPEEFYGVKPWEGFKNYRGEIPFDGRSVLVELNRSGICLAFSSAAHQRSGIMSNRLFEGLAAGAAVICNPHPFIDKYFSDCVYVVDDQGTSLELCEKVQEIVNRVRQDPEDALRRARLGQQRLAERFSLDGCLADLLAGHGERTERRRNATLGEPGSVSVLALFSEGGLDILADMIANATRQVNVATHLTILCPASFGEVHRDEIDSLVQAARAAPAIASINVRPYDGFGDSASALASARGAVVADILRRVDSEFLAFMDCDEFWFSGHLAALVEALRRSPDAQAAVSGKIIEDMVGDSKARRRLDGLGFGSAADLIEATYPDDAGRFLFRAELSSRVPEALMPLLDGCEPRALRLWAAMEGALALTNEASFVAMREREVYRLLRRTPEFEQIETIRDAVRGKALWLRRRAELSANGLIGHHVTHQLPLNRTLETREGSHGLAFLRAGFSAPEPELVWVDGRSGRLEFLMPAGKTGVEISLLVAARGQGERLCTVLANGAPILVDASIDDKPVELFATLPPVSGAGLGKMTIVVQISAADQVRDKHGKVVDPRYLGFYLRQFGVFERMTPSLPLGKLCDLGKNGEATATIRSGFSYPEQGFVWLEGKTGRLAFTIEGDDVEHELRLVVHGRKSKLGEDQVCTVLLNDEPVLVDAVVPEAAMELTLPLTVVPAGRTTKMQLEIQLKHADSTYDQAGRVLDPRRLGLQLIGIGRFARTVPAEDAQSLQTVAPVLAPTSVSTEARAGLRRFFGFGKPR